ncbi:E3 ubiquitin-protein ligase RNF217 [Scleropages formosus]|uniref:E3 ubiquitin-protein ligase RNF217 n=1 Tax=Scleropages formosus TaxID=113540 RepID=A0A8D0CL60_SCLFO|nr:probable E3 ubiquitin-protein ligase RNF217 [Scleropages formosus]
MCVCLSARESERDGACVRACLCLFACSWKERARERMGDELGHATPDSASGGGGVEGRHGAREDVVDFGHGSGSVAAKVVSADGQDAVDVVGGGEGFANYAADGLERVTPPERALGLTRRSPSFRRDEVGEQHVYCTVYCIAQDSHGRDARDPGGGVVPEGDDDDDGGQGGSGAPSASEGDTDPDPEEPPGVPRDTHSTADPFYGVDYNVSVVLTCRVCLEEQRVTPMQCCRKAVCEDCLRAYISSQVHMGRVDIVCPITECTGYVEESRIIDLLFSEEVAKYKYFLELNRVDSNTKPCPQCNLFTSLKGRGPQAPGRAEHKYKVQCSRCQFVWCFKCHAPWHEGIKCKDYRKGDKLLRHWASAIEHGQRNAQKCPRCKIHIQRTEGCDHMSCTLCNTSFCYRCGEKYRHLRFFGDHSSNLSVFGCKYRYLPEKPHLRRLVRGSVCVSKILVAPLVIVLVGVFGVLAVVVGLVAFPIYYICKKRRKRSQGSGRWFC